jgi:3-oxoacyl-[acyl-carrier-protein] synthase-3
MAGRRFGVVSEKQRNVAMARNPLLKQMPFCFSGIGLALASGRLNNEALAAELDVEAEWISVRCGVQSRCIARPDETTTSLAIEAGRRALSVAGEPDCIICSTFTPDFPLCPCAPSVAEALGLRGIAAFDLNAACSGGIVGLITALSFLSSGVARRVLLIASDTTTKHLAREDRQTRLLFGDAAAALVIESAPAGGLSLLSCAMGSDGAGAKLFYVPEGGSRLPWRAGSSRNGCAGTVLMEGPALFRFAVQKGSQMLLSVCDQAGIASTEVDWVLIHQANMRIIEALQQCTRIPGERWVVNLPQIGNTGSSSVLLTLADLLCRGCLQPSQRILIGAFGAGLTWAGALLTCGP